MDFGPHNIFPFQFVAATQPINALAFVFDGVNFGASDFAYSAYSMVSSHAIPFLFLVSTTQIKHILKAKM